MSAASDDTILEQLLERALDLQEQGKPVDVALLCAEHPRFTASVAAALARVPELARMHVETAQADAFVGRLLARRYRLEERIGSGAMGVVYRAFDLALDRAVAVKVLRPELLVGERMDVRLAREGQVLAGIRHRNVVTVFDRGQAEDGRSFLVMELLRGQNASRLLRNVADAHGGPVNGSARAAALRDALGVDIPVGEGDVRQVVRWIVAAADGLQAAHDNGVVHRDVKPSNLFLELGGRVVLLDFGIVSSGGQGTLGSDGSPFGTPAYMAPEQLEAGAEPDLRSDVYSLTATLYHLLTGRAPFDGTVQQVLAAIPVVEPAAVERVRPGLPGDLAAIVEKGMAKDAARRYQSARELRDDLQAWLEFRPITARRSSPLRMALRRVRRSPRVRTAVGMLLLAALLVGGWQWSVAHAEARRGRSSDAWRCVPPSLLSGPADYRATSALRHSAGLDDLLDELVALDDGSGIALAVRAIHRSDGGDLAAAAADLELLAARGDAPFAATAASAYRRGESPDALAQGAEAPVHGGIGDRVAVALHAMRSRAPRPSWVAGMLREHPAAERLPGVAELLLLCEQGNAEAEPGFEAKLETFDALRDQAQRLEAVRGRPSAITLLVQVNALRLRARCEEARELAVAAQRLAPDCFVLHLVEASAALRLGDWEPAVDACRRAIARQPLSLNAHDWLIRAMIGAHRFDEAESALRDAVFTRSAEAGSRRHELEGLMLFRRALMAATAEAEAADAPDDATPPESELLATRARDCFRRARQAAGLDARPVLEELLCGYLIGDGESFAQVFALLAQQPLDAELLLRVAMFLPEELGPDETRLLGALLRRQAAGLGLRAR